MRNLHLTSSAHSVIHFSTLSRLLCQGLQCCSQEGSGGP